MTGDVTHFRPTHSPILLCVLVLTAKVCFGEGIYCMYRVGFSNPGVGGWGGNRYTCIYTFFSISLEI